MKGLSDQEQWLDQWYDWFHRIRVYLALDPDAALPEATRTKLIGAIDQDAIAGEVFASQLPPGEGRDATRRVVRKLDGLSVRLCSGLASLTPSIPEKY